MIACRTGAGPAFERSGIWGSDLVKLRETLLEEEIIDETGLLTEAFFESGIMLPRPLANALGTYSNSSIAANTFFLVFSLSTSLFLLILDTVAIDTPALFYTS